jgi:hypothetical protein
MANVVQIIPVTTMGRLTLEDEEIKMENQAELGNGSQDRTYSSSMLKRKNIEEFSVERSPKRLKEEALTEPGHTLLKPQESWWVNPDTKERPPIFSADGDSLPYLLVWDMRIVSD